MTTKHTEREELMQLVDDYMAACVAYTKPHGSALTVLATKELVKAKIDALLAEDKPCIHDAEWIARRTQEAYEQGRLAEEAAK